MASDSNSFTSSPSTQKFEQKGVGVQYPKINSIFDFSAEALGQISLWLEQNPPAFPITSIIGFSQFTASFNVVDGIVSTNSNGYTDLSGGPTLTGLSNGNYLILYGAAAYTDTVGAGFGATISFQVNSLTYGDLEECRTPVGDYQSIARVIPKTLNGGSNNTLTMKYRATGGPAQTAYFQHRWIAALRYSNL